MILKLLYVLATAIIFATTFGTIKYYKPACDFKTDTPSTCKMALGD